MGDIKNFSELELIVSDLKGKGKKVVHSHGVFDVLHSGHLHHFREAKNQGDVLVVSITGDEFIDKGPGRPHYDEQIRANFLSELNSIDYITIVNEPTAMGALQLIRPDIYVKGSEFKEKDLTGRITPEAEFVEKIGGKMYYADVVLEDPKNKLSSSTLIHKNSYSEETNEYLEKLKSEVSAEEVIESIDSLKNLKILLIGDTIIDEYRYQGILDRPPKEAMVCGRYLYTERFAGATLAAANHLSGFSDNVEVLTCLGTKNGDYSYFINNSLNNNVKLKIIGREDVPTVIKRRFVEDHPQMRKLYEECEVDDTPLPKELEDEVALYLNQNLSKYDIVAVSDFGHGFIGDNMINELSEKSKFLAVMTQNNESNFGFNPITKYPRADYVCIDEPEVRLATHSKYGDIKDLVIKLKEEKDYDKFAVTRGHYGSLVYDSKTGFEQVPPFFSKKFVDPIGAGDAYFSITAPYSSLNKPVNLTGFVGNAVGSLAVQFVGNKESIGPDKLYKFINTLLK
jgi:rfaE bifunctional protein nucleotidyltransferase chain/domain